MKKIVITITGIVAAIILGIIIGRTLAPGADSAGGTANSGEREVLYWGIFPKI